MKRFKISLLLLAVASLCITANAQRGNDSFYAMRTLMLIAPTNISAGVVAVSNICDIHGLTGIAKVDVSIAPYAPVDVTGVMFYGSTDKTNWSLLTSAAWATNNAISTTNSALSINYPGLTSNTVNYYYLPGNIISPTAATAGYATPYLSPAPMSAIGTNTITGAGILSMGFNAEDAPRYLRTVVWFGGGGTNGVSAILTGHSTQFP